MPEAITIEPFFDKDYPAICEWWNGHPDWQPVPLDHLSQYGFVAEQNGEKLAAVWVYLSDNAFAWMEFMVTNPKARTTQRVAAIGKVVDHALLFAHQKGARSVFTASNNDGLGRLYQKHGFIETEKKVTHYIARLT